MALESTNLPEQEHSIKARAHELYVEPTRPAPPTKSVKPFLVYLRETPAEPLSSNVKTVLWIVAVIVALLFLAALWRLASRHGLKQRTENREPAAPSALRQMRLDSRGAPCDPVFYIFPDVV
jgi:hypothetical protein